MRTIVGLIAGAAVLVAGAAQAQSVRGVTDKEIVLGTSLDLSGPITFWGVPMRNGHILRIEEENAKGGVHGRKIRLIVEEPEEPGEPEEQARIALPPAQPGVRRRVTAPPLQRPPPRRRSFFARWPRCPWLADPEVRWSR